MPNNTNSPKLSDFYLLSAAAYQVSPTAPDGWTILPSSDLTEPLEKDPDGFRAEVFDRPDPYISGNEDYVLAFAGTVPGFSGYQKGTLQADAYIASSVISSSYPPASFGDAVALYNSVVAFANGKDGTNYNIFVTGPDYLSV